MTLKKGGLTRATDSEGSWQLDHIVSELHDIRTRWRGAQQRTTECGAREFPSREALRDIAEALCGALFPMRLGPSDLHQESEDFYIGYTLDAALNALLHQVRLELRYDARRAASPQSDVDLLARAIVAEFALSLPGLRALLDTDVLAAYQGDPAARSVDEVLLCYPGVLAVIHHRIAHKLYALGVPLVARIISEAAHSSTGIDIHPGAQIGAGFFIDHGTGVVIGETAVIGERVRLYQAVTLGAKRFPADEAGTLQKGLPRHPVVEDDVVIYAGATILGRVTIGRGSTIGGNVWLTRSVPPGSQVTQANSQNVPVAAELVEP
ncbi:MAG: serine acetyltransferase [Methyloversatilis discipulorum]|uniref:serine O-acetyltransferase EpsC n=1 Tax=Methyloversatilis discipulorum TaxID=1119528 RepID=UPI0026F186F9|nr:serine O-acetyltransferase EpsC [Methyloversatilis discipulorum]MBT9515996.1 serine acetyltransferase [Methyloversatilis discipulorum]